jgi:MYXO-CTERM domain-containing protein
MWVKDSEQTKEKRLLPAVAITPQGDVLAAGGEALDGFPSSTADWLVFTHKGQKCASNDECATGACVEGVCCDQACDGPCVACTNALTGKDDGTCAPTAENSNPHDRCQDKKFDCGTQPICDGQGACKSYVGGGEGCKPDDCSGGYLATYSCQAAGASGCQPTSLLCPGNLACLGQQCRTGSCNSAAECATGFACVGQACVGATPNGQPCQNKTQCASGLCADGVCCNEACDGVCEACSSDTTTDGSTGVCKPAKQGSHQRCENKCDPASVGLILQACNGTTSKVCPIENYAFCNGGVCVSGTSGPDPDHCQLTCATGTDCGDMTKSFCDHGQCRFLNLLELGEPCDDTRLCKKGSCVEGVCCDGGCDGPCQSCLNTNTDQADGICAPAKEGKNPKQACVETHPDDLCQSRTLCNGVATLECPFISTKQPAFSVCEPHPGGSDRIVTYTCDATGNRTTLATRDCFPSHCDPTASPNDASCQSTCAANTDCAAGSSCFVCPSGLACAGSKETPNTCITHDFCLDSGNMQTASGQQSACRAGQICRPGQPDRCLAPCETSADCQTGKVCRSDGTCRDPIGSGTLDADCACSTPGRPAASWWPVATLAALALVRRRRRASAAR